MIKIKNWRSYQSYTDRRPSWIRLHKALLDDYEFQLMSDKARALLPMLWLLASEDEDPVSGLIRFSYEVVSFRLRIEKKELISIIEELCGSGFIEIIPAEKYVCNESVTSEERREDTEKIRGDRPRRTKTDQKLELDEIKEIVDRWNAFAQEQSISLVEKVTVKRKRAISARKSDGMLDRLDDVFREIKNSEFLLGVTGRESWHGADFDFVFCSPHNWVKILEGKYRDKGKGSRDSRIRNSVQGAQKASGKYAGRDKWAETG